MVLCQQKYTGTVDINVEGSFKLTVEGGFNIALQLKLINAEPEPIRSPTTFNDDNNVDVLETTKLKNCFIEYCC